MRTHSIFTDGQAEPFPCGEEESVLAAMRRAGRGPIACGCFGGGCGVCKMTVTQGDYLQCKPMSRAHVSAREAQNGTVLICCIKPLGDLHLQSI